jgi:predicted Zn-ribbon and HTH transcriptional regulator
MSDTPTPRSILQDRLLSLVHAFGDEERKYAVRHLASEVGQLERELAAVTKERDDALAMLGCYKMDKDDLKARIKRLEEAGDAQTERLLINFMECHNCGGSGQDYDGDVWVDEDCPFCKPDRDLVAGWRKLKTENA